MAYGKYDIGRRSLQTNYYTFYMVITWFLIILSVTACATSIYLIVENYKDAPDTDVQKALSYFSAITLGLIALALGLYYIYYISNSIYHSDIVATDLTRITTEPVDEFSFKNNLANFVANKTGQSKNRIFAGLNDNMTLLNDKFYDSLKGRGINPNDFNSSVNDYYSNSVYQRPKAPPRAGPRQSLFNDESEEETY